MNEAEKNHRKYRKEGCLQSWKAFLQSRTDKAKRLDEMQRQQKEAIDEVTEMMGEQVSLV